MQKNLNSSHPTTLRPPRQTFAMFFGKIGILSLEKRLIYVS